MGGLKIEDKLVKKDLFPVEKCSGKELEKCMVCKTFGSDIPKMSCKKNDVN